MTPELRAVFTAAVERLVEAVGETETRELMAEVMRRMGDGGTPREWGAMIRVVALERYPEARVQ